ncbi:MAG: retention module-containing protein, partial [Desulfobulbaceae bacterium]|nr:retention module-containing protein [Desulfobulbaceae bacterium]
MAQSGKIQAITGLVTARTPEGQVRELQLGDFVYENEIIETSTGARLSILQENGDRIALNSNDQIFLDESVTGRINPNDAVIQEVTDLQKAIVEALENNKDIDELLDDTAAVGLIDSYDHQAGFHSGDATKGDVGSYLLDAGTTSETQLFDQLTPIDTNDNDFETVVVSDDIPIEATATISLNGDITGDAILNATEAASNVTITGTVGGDVQDGDTVTLITNGNTYTGTVSGGTFNIEVAGVDLRDDINGEIEASVTTDRIFGTPVTATDTQSYSVDTTAAATITVDNITQDDVINAIEAGETISVTGSTGGDAAHGDTISLTINRINYTGTVTDDGSFSIDVSGADLAADTSFTAILTGTDDAGNPFVATTISTHTIDETASFADQAHDYEENQVTGATVATLTAGDVDGIAGFTFSLTGTDTSADG